MKKSLKNLLLLFIVIFSICNYSKLNAQVDTTFWFAASWVTPDHASNRPMAFHFSTFNNPTTIRLRQPASTYDTTFLVPSNTLFSKAVSHLLDSLESKPAANILRTGFNITSDFPIVVVYDFLSTGNNPETYSLKGQNGLGTEFVVPFQTIWNNRTLNQDRNNDGVVTQPKQQFTVVASEDNTTLFITPRCATVGGFTPNVTYSVFLPIAGNTYTVENVTLITSMAGNNLAGTIVTSDKKIAITVSDDSVNPSGGGGCFDIMGDQIVPVDVIGRDYIVNKGFLNSGSDESAFITATENFTTVTVDNGLAITTVTLNQGDTYQYSITEQLTYIQADKKVYLLHMSGYGCELGQAILPPLSCAGSDQVSFPRTNNRSFLLNLLCPAGSEGDFLVNGSVTTVQASDFSPVPGTSGLWMGAQVNIPTNVIAQNTSNLIQNTSSLFSLGIINGTPTGGCLYHYLSVFNRQVFVVAGNDTILCNGEPQINLNGQVTGGNTVGEWAVLNGTGTLNSPNSLSTSYIPSDADYTQGGLTFTLTSVGNCDPVIDTMRVQFIQSPIVNAVGDDTFCENNILEFPINGTVQFAATAVWSGGFGGSFSNIGALNNTYRPSPTDIANDSVALYLTSAGSFFSCGSDVDTVIVYFTDAPQVNAGVSETICEEDLVFDLNATITGGASTGEWTTNGNGSFTASNNDLTGSYLLTPSDIASGSIRLILTSTNNGSCLEQKDSIDITILPQPTLEITSLDSVCDNLTSFNLQGTVTAGYSTIWTTSGAGTITLPSSLNTSYFIANADTAIGYIDVVLSATSGQCTLENDSIRVQFITPAKVNAGLDQSYCKNDLVQLNGTINGSASSNFWTSNGTGTFIPSSNLLSTIYRPSSNDVQAGNIDLILTSVNNFGCPPDEDTLTVNFIEIPNANFQTNAACEGNNSLFFDASSINGGTITNWTWDFGDMTTSATQNPEHIYSGSGTYSVSLIVQGNNGCIDTIQKNLIIDPVPTASFTNDYICVGEEVIFEDNSFINSGVITSYEYNLGDGSPLISTPNTSHIYNSTGSYTINYTVTSNLNCTNTISKLVNVLAGPTANFSALPNPAVVLEDIEFNDLSTGDSIVDWIWNFDDGSGDNTENTFHNYAEGGKYNVLLTIMDTSGCQDTISKEISIALLPVLPTAFTPNGDGENDFFLIRGGPFSAVDFKIYNNWGELIYQTNEATPGWDGTFKGKPAVLGVYTWTFEVVIPGDRNIKKSGDVTLIR